MTDGSFWTNRSGISMHVFLIAGSVPVWQKHVRVTFSGTGEQSINEIHNKIDRECSLMFSGALSTLRDGIKSSMTFAIAQ